MTPLYKRVERRLRNMARREGWGIHDMEYYMSEGNVGHEVVRARFTNGQQSKWLQSVLQEDVSLKDYIKQTTTDLRKAFSQ